MDDDFAPLTIPQLRNHCAPTSLSYCLYLLGIEATQRQLAHAAGVPWRVFRDGLDEDGVRQAANACGVSARFLLVPDWRDGPQFASRLGRHLKRGCPAMLLVWDFAHWVALLGCTADGRFILADPEDEDRAFSKWTERTLLENGWNEHEDEEEPDQYFAILFSRKDGKPSRWKLTDAWLKLCERGSEETLADMARDITEVARRAGGIVKNQRRGVELASLLRHYEETVAKEVAHWVQADVRVRDLRHLYRDFRVTAEALRLRVPRNVDRARIVAQMTVLLATWSWTDEL